MISPEDDGLGVNAFRFPQFIINRLSNLFTNGIFNRKIIEIFNDNGIPDFFVKVFINDIEFTSNVWRDTKYVYDPDWSATLNVPDEQEFVNIKIQLFF